MRRTVSLPILLILSLLLAACSASGPRPTPTTAAPTVIATIAEPTPTLQPMDVADTLAAAGDFATLVTALQVANLSESLKGSDPVTIFAPTDQAFAALAPGLLDNQDRLAEVLRYHIAATRVTSDSLTSGATVKTLLGNELKVSQEGKIIKVNDATIIATPIQATNGVIYVLDKVLLPPAKASAANSKATISEVLLTDERFSTLVDALKATGVYTELQGAGPFTLFAPEQDAFSNLPSPLVGSLFRGPEVWTRVLNYHVISGKKLLAADFTDQQVEQTLEGSTLVFSKQGATTLVGEAKIIQTDIQASNGVIHVIDKVLVPPLD
ncbi:MAG: fasciclin domain-containing protein [Chloroflexi bacterium]|nr:fasciclin domain-containing protein [Chloroflexota bacterium]